jgi:hypothetical protein
MYRTCPKCGHRRQPADRGPADSCPRCGLVFSKWLKLRYARARPRTEAVTGDAVERESLASILLYVPPATTGALAGRAVLYAAFLAWGLHFIALDMESNLIGASFMHNIDLVFHEAGHVLFRPFGRFMTILGGSLGQLIMPAVVIGAFIWHNRDNFAASLGLWWLGQSLMDLAPYINDARAGVLPLLGGLTGQDAPGRHDWHRILSDLNMLALDHRIARTVDGLGVAVMLAALAWGGYLLYRQYRLPRSLQP